MGEWKHIITIGREYGAGGRSVAKRISDLLGIPHYDKEIIQLAAEKTGLSEEMIRGTEEHESGKTLLNWFLPSGSASAYDQAILAQAQTIRKIAEQGPCVIVGRGADYILRTTSKSTAPYAACNTSAPKTGIINGINLFKILPCVKSAFSL